MPLRAEANAPPGYMTIVSETPALASYNETKSSAICRFSIVARMSALPVSVARRSMLKRHVALPAEHGAWVFLLSPLLIGLFAGRAAGGAWTPGVGWLVLAALAAFLLRQPVTVAVKAWAGRRSRAELPAAALWTAAYGLALCAGVGGLWAQGHGWVLLLALPAGPVFAWHLALIRRRAERRQMGVEVVGSGVLALAAPAAYWVMLGTAEAAGWWLWLLAWLQSAASIVYAYLRLEQRVLPAVPPLAQRLGLARRALLYAGFNVLLAAALSLARLAPPALVAPFALQLAETVWGALRPAVGVPPVRIGLRQLVVSSLFTLLFILVWRPT
jgi:hypothetical protein